MASCCSIASVSEAREGSSTYWHRSVEAAGVGHGNITKANLFSGLPLLPPAQTQHSPRALKKQEGEAAPHGACQPSWCARAASPRLAPCQPGPKQAAPSPAPYVSLPSLLVSFPHRAPVLGQPWPALQAGWTALLFHSLAVQGQSQPCVKRPKWCLVHLWIFRPEFPFPPRILSVTKPGLETLCLNNRVWISFSLVWIYNFICLISRARDSQLQWDSITRTKVSVHPGQKNWNHLCLKYMTCVPHLQNSYLKDTDLMSCRVRKLTASLSAHFPSHSVRQTGPISLLERGMGGVAHAFIVPHAMPCTWTRHWCLSFPPCVFHWMN